MGAPLAQQFWRQLYLIGVQSTGIVMLLAALAGGGFVLSLQATLPIGLNTTLELLGAFMVKVLGVVLTLLVLAAR
jgi:ABC-type transporter Mla maintaining outer membrane lipid asymmetry permease subunit MlaE